MTSLRELKKLASYYNAHFGGRGFRGRKWTKLERQTALNEREVFSR